MTTMDINTEAAEPADQEQSSHEVSNKSVTPDCMSGCPEAEEANEPAPAVTKND